MEQTVRGKYSEAQGPIPCHLPPRSLPFYCRCRSSSVRSTASPKPLSSPVPRIYPTFSAILIRFPHLKLPSSTTLPISTLKNRRLKAPRGMGGQDSVRVRPSGSNEGTAAKNSFPAYIPRWLSAFPLPKSITHFLMDMTRGCSTVTVCYGTEIGSSTAPYCFCSCYGERVRRHFTIRFVYCDRIRLCQIKR